MRLTRRRKAMSDKHHLSRKPLSRFIISTAWYLALYRVLKRQAEGIEQAGPVISSCKPKKGANPDETGDWHSVPQGESVLSIHGKM